jgi:hypothetical protein
VIQQSPLPLGLQDVSHEVFAELNLAESQGKYFNANIAKKYSYKKVL